MHTNTGDHNAQGLALGIPLPSRVQTLYTVDQLVEAEPALGKGAIRHDLFHRQTNGLSQSGAIIRRGRRLVIHREKYLAWMATATEGAR